jgi:hypothetical protein
MLVAIHWPEACALLERPRALFYPWDLSTAPRRCKYLAANQQRRPQTNPNAQPASTSVG